MTKIVIITDREADEEEVVHRMSDHHGKSEYVSLHGKHFNSKLLNYATNKMYRSDGKPIVPWTEYEVDELLKKHNVISIMSLLRIWQKLISGNLR